MTHQNSTLVSRYGNPILYPVIAIITISALLVGCDLVTCDQTADRSTSVSAGGIDTVRIIAEAGSLDVEGQLNLTEVEAKGIACAGSSGDLDDIQFEVTTSGSEIVVEARTPDGNSQFDVTITVPNSVLIEIEDGSGSVDVRDVAGLQIDDGSGDVDVSNVSGNVVVIEDGSGDIGLRSISGAVDIEKDGSGEITVSDVGGDVLIAEDGSGSIHVTDVAGDFEVRQDGSGGIDHSGIAGTVDIPED
jgi:hypothetical protein